MDPIETAMPEHWRGLYELAKIPLAWIGPFQTELLRLLWSQDPFLLKRLFLILPALSIIAGLWCSMLALYTLPFRAGRVRFVGTLLVLWWDAARTAWLFWAGMAKFVFLLFGAFWGLVRLVAAVIEELILTLFALPYQLGGSLTRTLLQGGIPWIAVGMTFLWALLEGTIFTYMLTPLVSEILTDITGSETHRFLGPVLFCMLTPMILGSFACMHVLVEAVKTKDAAQIAQMALVELAVMLFEVWIFYRELIDALTPWIAQQTGMQMNIVHVFLFASLGWFAVRGMTWFLFARFGTPTLLAFISRQRLPEEGPAPAVAVAAEQRWDRAVNRLKEEQAWFQARAELILEALILPALQVVAAAVNFGTCLFLSRPVFSLPFRSLAEVGDTKALLQNIWGLERAS